MIDKLVEAIPVLVVPFLICLVIAALHCYMGLHVIRRGVIFVDLALAQCAALGAAVALFLTPVIWVDDHGAAAEKVVVGSEESTATGEGLLAEELANEDEGSLLEPGPGVDDAAAKRAQGHEEEHARFAYLMSLFFALLGAVLLSVGRFKDECVPHEAIIGIIFVVCASLSVLILSKSPHGHEEMEAMLIGSILFVDWPDLQAIFWLYVVLGALHIALRKKFIAISKDVAAAERTGMNVKLWDCIFFATFALMVTQSVGIAGVFVVFSYLIIPAACGAMFARRFGAQIAIAWLIALFGTMAGLAFSAVADMPTGSSLVSVFGAALVICVLLRPLVKRGAVSVA
jgi:zinc/manganese transport system permease protein